MDKLQTLSSLFQRLPLFRGKRRVCNWILRGSGLSKSRNVVINTKSGRFELPNLVEIISLDLFINGIYENGLVQFLSDRIPAGGVFIDVGANIGSISIPLAIKRPDITIVAIEASPWIYKILTGNISHNNIPNISAENYAVYSESGKDLPMYAPKDLFGKGSLKPVFTKDAEMVKTITVDDIKVKFNLPAIDCMKVDVEGFEAVVFKGMANVIKLKKPAIVFEFAQWTEQAAGFATGEAQDILLSAGYTLQKLDTGFHLTGTSQNKKFLEEEVNLYAS
jgi:FkbM family methyltransferase